jgi:hypothetical protein
MSKAIAKTIQIFLPDGDPKSIKVASITSRTVEVTYIPRSKLDEAKKRKNLDGVGVYMLVGFSEEHNKPEVYIGEAENCMVRIKQHNSEKDFWDYAFIITSLTNQFTKAHGKFMEWLCYRTGEDVGRCVINNSIAPTESYVGESAAADLYDSFETISVLVSTLGLPIFIPAIGVADFSKSASNTDIFFLTGRGGEAEGIYTEEGFVVLAGSKFAKDLVPSLKPPKIREKLISAKILVNKETIYELAEDTLFSSPSSAGDCVTGQSINGWTAWKLKDGRTLSDVYRKEMAT